MRVYKYHVPQIGVPVTHRLPPEAKITLFGRDYQKELNFWAVYHDVDLVERTFMAVPTGGEVLDKWVHLHSLVDSGLVWHLFEVK